MHLFTKQITQTAQSIRKRNTYTLLWPKGSLCYSYAEVGIVTCAHQVFLKHKNIISGGICSRHTISNQCMKLTEFHWTIFKIHFHQQITI